MTDEWARHIRLRLVAHFPSLGGDAHDPAAIVRMDDWLRAIRRADPNVAKEAAELIIESGSGYPPTIGTWQETCREIARRHALERESTERREIEAALDDLVGSRARIAELLEDARAKLADGRRHQPVRVIARVSKYDEIPGGPPLGDKHMTEDERQAELDAFGDRRVRPRRIAP